MSELLCELWTLVNAIPKGRVASYGRIGRALSSPVSGFLVGKWMARAPEGIPWWRIVAKEGSLPVDARSPQLGARQRELLACEGVEFDADRVRMEVAEWDPY